MGIAAEPSRAPRTAVCETASCTGHVRCAFRNRSPHGRSPCTAVCCPSSSPPSPSPRSAPPRPRPPRRGRPPRAPRSIRASRRSPTARSAPRTSSSTTPRTSTSARPRTARARARRPTPTAATPRRCRIGTPVDIDGAEQAGHARLQLVAHDAEPRARPTPTRAPSTTSRSSSIDPADVGKVNPSIPFWGGPTGVDPDGTVAGRQGPELRQLRAARRHHRSSARRRARASATTATAGRTPSTR